MWIRREPTSELVVHQEFREKGMGILKKIFGTSQPVTTGHFFLNKAGPLSPKEYGLCATKEAFASSQRLIDELLAIVPNIEDSFFSRIREKPSHLSSHLTFALMTAYANYVTAASKFVVGGGFSYDFDSGMRAGFQWLAEVSTAANDLERKKRFEDSAWVNWTMYLSEMRNDTLRRASRNRDISTKDEFVASLFVKNIVRLYDDDNYFAGRKYVVANQAEKEILNKLVSSSVRMKFEELDTSVRFIPEK